MSPSLPQSWKEGSACLKFDHSHACPEKDLPEHPLQINSVPPRVTCTLLPDVLASSLLPQFGVLHHQETTVNFCNNDLYSCPHPVLILPSQTPLRPHEVRGDSFGRTFSPYSVHLDFLLFSGFMPVELRWLMPTVCVLALVPHCSISKIISTQIICILHWCHVLSKSCYFPSHYCSCDSSPLREILCWNFNQSFGRIGEVQYTLIFRHGLDLKPCEPCPQIYLLYVVPHVQGKAELESTCLAVGWPCSPPLSGELSGLPIDLGTEASLCYLHQVLSPVEVKCLQGSGRHKARPHWWTRSCFHCLIPQLFINDPIVYQPPKVPSDEKPNLSNILNSLV